MGSYSKSEQLSRGPKRPARIKASRQEWAKIIIAKAGPCRCVGMGQCDGRTEFHHLLSRGQGGGDVFDNIVPLCTHHHRQVTENFSLARRHLAENLTDREYAFLIDELGEGAMERLFGVMDSRESGDAA